MSATVIIPTTGSPELSGAIDSVLKQTYEVKGLYLNNPGLFLLYIR